MRWFLASLVVAGCGFQPSGDSASDDAQVVQPDADKDSDGDGILDGVDNCPRMPNPDQRDFDGDHHGDICDRCPHLASDDDPDTDGDGVGDACDPRPMTPGDHRQYWFGYYDANDLTGWTPATVGSWSVAGGELVETTDTFTALTGPDKLGDVAFATSFEIVDPASQQIGACGSDRDTSQYYCCSVQNSTNQPSVLAVAPGNSAAATFGSLGVGARIDLTSTMTATQHTCTFTQGTATMTVQHTRSATQPGVFAFYTLAAMHARYLFVVAIGS